MVEIWDGRGVSLREGMVGVNGNMDGEEECIVCGGLLLMH